MGALSVEVMRETWTLMWTLMHQWWFWLVYIIFVVGVWYGYWCLFSRREYKEINGRLCVRHGKGRWLDLIEHMEREHPIEYDALKKRDGESKT